MRKIGLYIHIPFCSKRCIYCHFATDTVHNDKHLIYFDCLKQELLEQKELLKVPVSTIYFGGGTPSLVDPILIKDFLDYVRRNISLTKNPEITIECNPESITQDGLNIYHQAGVNRLSIGLQAWQNHHLKKLNRAHDIDTFLKTYTIINKSKIKNINIDLIFGLPNQTIGEWKQTLREVVKLGPSHISTYSLEYHPQTPLDGLEKSKKIAKTSDEVDRQMYHHTVKFLSKSGFHQYELSNFSKPNQESKHNLYFWLGHNYLGLGLSAASYIDGVEWENTVYWDKYINGEKTQKTKNSKSQINLNKLLLNIRLNRGVALKNLKSEKTNKLKKLKLIKQMGKRVFLTPLGQDLENQVARIITSSDKQSASMLV